MKWYIKILLKFKRTKFKITIEKDCFGMSQEGSLEYKILFKKQYRLSWIQLPPQHPNCKCVLPLISHHLQK